MSRAKARLTPWRSAAPIPPPRKTLRKPIAIPFPRPLGLWSIRQHHRPIIRRNPWTAFGLNIAAIMAESPTNLDVSRNRLFALDLAALDRDAGRRHCAR